MVFGGAVVIIKLRRYLPLVLLLILVAFTTKEVKAKTTYPVEVNKKNFPDNSFRSEILEEFGESLS